MLAVGPMGNLPVNPLLSDLANQYTTFGWIKDGVYVCSVFESIPADNRFIRAMILHVKILHKQAGGGASGCEMCKQIETNIESRQVTPIVKHPSRP